jgi:acetyl esterase/lipase
MFSRVASRADASCGVLCAPAILDPVELAKYFEKKNGGKLGHGPVQNTILAIEAKAGTNIEEIAKNPDRYGYSSAATEVAKVRFPLLIINGKNDTACPQVVAETYVQKLKAAGKTVETYYPDNGPHGFYFGNPREIPETKIAADRMVEFMKKYLDKPAGHLITLPASKSQP